MAGQELGDWVISGTHFPAYTVNLMRLYIVKNI
jgi:hypothetical protein